MTPDFPSYGLDAKGIPHGKKAPSTIHQQGHGSFCVVGERI
jgi:hypothetical protein